MGICGGKPAAGLDGGGRAHSSTPAMGANQFAAITTGIKQQDEQLKNMTVPPPPPPPRRRAPRAASAARARGVRGPLRLQRLDFSQLLSQSECGRAVTRVCFAVRPLQRGQTEGSRHVRGITFTLANNGEEVVVDEGKTLGKGNYGVVYKGIHKPTGGGVAVKEILFPEDDPEECEYLKEVRRAPADGWCMCRHAAARGPMRAQNSYSAPGGGALRTGPTRLRCASAWTTPAASRRWAGPSRPSISSCRSSSASGGPQHLPVTVPWVGTRERGLEGRGGEGG